METKIVIFILLMGWLPGYCLASSESERLPLAELCAASNVENWNHSDQNGVTGSTKKEMRNSVQSFRFDLEKRLNLTNGLPAALQNSTNGAHDRDTSLDSQFESFMKSFNEHDLRYWAGAVFGPLTCNPLDMGCMRSFEKGLSGWT